MNEAQVLRAAKRRGVKQTNKAWPSIQDLLRDLAGTPSPDDMRRVADTVARLGRYTRSPQQKQAFVKAEWALRKREADVKQARQWLLVAYREGYRPR